MNKIFYVVSQIENMYDKIILVDVKENDYEIIKDNNNDIIFSNLFEEQWNKYCDAYIHEHDKDNFKLFLDNFCNKSNMIFRKKYEDDYEWNFLEVLECDDSTKITPKYLFLIKKVEPTFTGISYNNINYETGLYNADTYNNMLNKIDYNCYIIYLGIKDKDKIMQALTYLHISFPNIDKYSIKDNIAAMIYTGDYDTLKVYFNNYSLMMKNNNIKVCAGVREHNEKNTVEETNNEAYKMLKKNLKK